MRLVQSGPRASGIICKEEALRQVGPLLPLLSEASHTAWMRWDKDHGRKLQFRRTTRANLLADLFWEELGKRLPDRGLKVVEVHARKLLSIGGHLVIQFKKLDARGQPRNYPTQTALAFGAQEPLPIIGTAPRLTLGYYLDGLETEIQEIRLLCTNAEGVAWYHTVEAPVLAEIAVLRPASAGIARPRLVAKRVRREDESDSSG